MRLWVLGHDVAFTPAPAMFEATLADLGIEGWCHLRDVEPRLLRAVIDQVRNGVVEGCIVLRPHRGPMLDLCSDVSREAELVGGVNTVVITDGELHGDSTEALGFELGLSTQRMWPRDGGRAVIFGAGAGAAAAARALGRVPSSDIAICARDVAAANVLTQRLGPSSAMSILPWDRAAAKDAVQAADIVVNATPAGLAGLPFDVHALSLGSTVVDMRVRSAPGDVVEAALARGHRACGGFEIYFYTQMLAFARCAGVESTWTAARRTLERELRRAPAGAL